MILSRQQYEVLLRSDLVTFIERSFYELNAGKRLLLTAYIEVIATKLEAVRLGKIKRLIICLPPRSLKSHCASIVFPAWCLGHDPSISIICASYGQDLAEKLGRDCRTLMSGAFYQGLFPTRLADRRLHDFATMAGGGRKSTSIGGPLTGRGADLLIIDDPLKPEAALSETGRNGANEWVGSTLFTRLDDKINGTIILVMQRLHQNDLAGFLLEHGDWDVLSLPAIATEDEVHPIERPFGHRLWRRPEGTVLHPERESLADLQAIKATIGEYNFSAQYQQMPIPIGGAIIKTEWFRYYEPSRIQEGFAVTLQSWDTASKATELNDYSVCTTWGVTDRKFYLLDVFRKRVNYPDLKRAAKDLYGRFRPTVVLIEDQASGTQLIQDLQHEGLFGVKPYKPPPRSDKIMRLHAQSAKFEGGQVFLPREASWLTAYITELTGFPGTRFDDQVDSTTQALDYLNQYYPLELWIKLGTMD